jgi:hypothetical protein
LSFRTRRLFQAGEEPAFDVFVRLILVMLQEEIEEVSEKK